jgi:hypothetical protein
MTYEPAFPSEIEPAASALLSSLSVGELHSPHQGFVVQVHSQTLSAPSRVYYSTDRLLTHIRNARGESRILALCLGTCHHDGFVREHCVRELIEIDRTWAVPFVVKLLGEYVIQIANVIIAALPRVSRTTYGEFVRENPQFFATTKRRVVSYWDCYYRGSYSRLAEYPPFLAIEHIEGMA